MKKIIISGLSMLFLASCSLITPYKITFTTPSLSAINPYEDTLDLAISHPAMAYISNIKCEGHDVLNMLPVVNEDMSVSNVHNLKLDALQNYAPQTLCEINVTAFDNSTTSTTSGNITLYVLEKPSNTDEISSKANMCEEKGGVWNECGSACKEGDEFCVQVCVPQCEFPPVEESTEIKVETEIETEIND